MSDPTPPSGQPSHPKFIKPERLPDSIRDKIPASIRNKLPPDTKVTVRRYSNIEHHPAAGDPPAEPKEPLTGDAERLRKILAAQHPAVSIVTKDELEAAELVTQVAQHLDAPIWTWTAIEGVNDPSRAHDQAIPETENPAAGLYWLSQQAYPGVQIVFDLTDHLADPHALRALRRLIHANERIGGHVVLIDHTKPPRAVIAESVTPFSLSLPDQSEIEQEVRTALRSIHQHTPIKVEMSKGQFNIFLRNLAGLTRRQIRQITREVVTDDQSFDEQDLNQALALKRTLVSNNGTLEFVESPTSLDQIGGLSKLKAWLADRERSFEDSAKEFGLTPPRGVLLLGVQGAGKSLSAKAIATAWNRPLLRLDPSSLYDRFVGESERKLRDALAQAEAMAPIVLWIDEIEKGFASAAAHSTDGGLSQRMFGTLLTWMNDHTEPVFLVATANNIDALPPELLRKGRFDEIFFVDLPRQDAREIIFKIHITKRQRDPAQFDLTKLAKHAEGFSGAEIEQAVLAATHAAFAAGREPNTDDILEVVRTSPPLSVTMRERIDALRDWATDRCMPAD